jgi:endonuclease/exonuclease/phosphatase family metal-dependent hydrolase
MSKKKSSFRHFTKRFLLIVNIIVSILLIYPLYLTPLPFIWINGFLGIAAPYLILAQVLLLLLWLLAKPIMTLLPLISLGLVWQTIMAIFAWHPGGQFTPQKKQGSLRIVSWNIKEFNGNQKNKSQHKFRAEAIADGVQKWNPDIICLQEYNTKERPNDAANHAQYFNKKYPFSFFSKDYQTNEPEYFAGCIIYSKYPIIDSKRIAYNNGESLIYTTLQKGDDTIRVYTSHLASYRFKQNDFEPNASPDDELIVKANFSVLKKMKEAFVERAVQANTIRAELDRSPYPTIITGDFNDVPSSYTYRTIRGDWQDAFLSKGLGIGSTYLGISPTLRIDYILPNKNWEVKSWESVDENLSDHHLVMADLLLLKK